jgi:putative membrane protein
MIRRVTPIICSSLLGLLAVHCGGGSTPPSNTPESQSVESNPPVQSSEGQPGAAGTSNSSDAPIVGSASGMPDSSSKWSNERMPTGGRDEPGTNDTGSHPSGGALSDGQVAAIADLVNSSEIEQAQLAQTRSKNPEVLRFAAMMISHHGQARQQQAALGVSSVASPMLLSLSEQGRQTLATLKSKEGQDFDRAYLQAQVEQHQKALDMMDRQLLPSAEKSELRAQLQKMRPVVEQHLTAARQALQSLGTSGQKSEGASRTGTIGSSSTTGNTGSGR